jgi:phosphate transport system protein
MSIDMSLRPAYDEKLTEIKSDILHMGGIAGEMARLAVDAVLNGKVDLANHVIGMDDEVDSLEKSILQKTVSVVALETPVASDLRLLVSTLGITGEIEKVADDAVKLARRATRLSGHFPAEMKRALMELGEAASKAFASVLRLYSDYNPELAEAVIRSDKEIDGQYVGARSRVLDLIRKNPAETEHLVRTIDAFHALEHIADHAVEIASRLRFHNQGVCARLEA